MRAILDTFGADGAAEQSNPQKVQDLIRRTLDYPDSHFDGVLVWDLLEYLVPSLTTEVVERLHKIMRPGGWLLAFFSSHTDISHTVPHCTFRLQETDELLVVQSGSMQRVQILDNRQVERLFSPFKSVRFFLRRENWRSVIVQS
jgi:hypothetical protein